MKLLLVRHGKTIENERGILQGHIPGTLSTAGLEQAKNIALRLKDEKINRIYSSDLRRAADTAKEIGKFHQDVTVNFVKDLRERFLGPHQGKQMRTVFGEFGDEVESQQDMKNRVSKLLNEVYEKYPQMTILFVAHGGINKVLTSYITGIPMNKITSQPNASLSVFEISSLKNKTILQNSVDHLQ